MKIFSSQDFAKLVGKYDQNWILEIIKLHNIQFITFNIVAGRTMNMKVFI